MLKLLTLSLFAAAPALAQDLEIAGRAEQGALIYVKTDGQVQFEGRTLKHNDGWVVIGFGRDQTTPAKFTVDGKPYEIDVAMRQWKEEKIDGLPSAKVNPPTAANRRIEREARMLKDSRKADTADFLPKCFMQPVEGRISGVFGSRRVLNGIPKRPHYGLDIAATTGTPVQATADGRVMLAMPDSFYNGNVVVIDHGLGVSSLYAHMDSITAKQGARVRRGDVIGAVGQTGRATGPHLHFAISFFDSFLDPKSVILNAICTE